MEGSLIGYHQLDSEQIININKTKQFESDIMEFIDMLLKEGADPRLSAMARSHFEIGAMCVNKAIARAR